MPAHVVRANVVVNIPSVRRTPSVSANPIKSWIEEQSGISLYRHDRYFDFMERRERAKSYRTRNACSTSHVLPISFVTRCAQIPPSGRKETTTWKRRMGKRVFFAYVFAALRVAFSRNSNHDWLGELSNTSVDQTVKFSEHPADATHNVTIITLTHTGIHSTHKTYAAGLRER